MTGTVRPTVLIVDDEPLLRSLLVRVLERAGFRALAVADGDSAVRAAKERPEIQALVLDLTLPPHGGVAVAESLSAVRSDLAVILTSGAGPPRAVEAMLASPRFEFLRKPFSPQALADRLRNRIGG